MQWPKRSDTTRKASEMAHNIWMTDALFSVRKPTWHGLGEILPEYPVREEAQKIAHPWEPVTARVFQEVPSLHYDETQDRWDPTTEFHVVEDYQAVVRSDNSEVLGVVGKNYSPVSNDEMWDIAEAVQGGGIDVQYETAGSLEGGRKVWVMLRLDEPVKVKGDPRGETLPYYVVQNAHDGTASFRGQAVMTRVVCANTSRIADMDAKAAGTEFTFRHTRNVKDRIEEAQQALQGWRHSIEEWRLMQEHLVDEKVSDDGVREFIERFIPEPEVDMISDRTRRNIYTAREALQGSLSSITCEGIENTKAGLVAAAVEYSEHLRRAHSQETRMSRTLLKPNELVQYATKIALEVV